MSHNPPAGFQLSALALIHIATALARTVPDKRHREMIANHIAILLAPEERREMFRHAGIEEPAPLTVDELMRVEQMADAYRCLVISLPKNFLAFDLWNAVSGAAEAKGYSLKNAPRDMLMWMMVPRSGAKG